MAQAARGDWLARARGIHVNPDAGCSALNIDVNSRTTIEADFSYFVTNNLALELILATKKHQVTAEGVPVGNVKHLPLPLQYQFLPKGTSRLYLGKGSNYTRLYDIKLGGDTLTVDNNSCGGALQAGTDR